MSFENLFGREGSGFVLLDSTRWHNDMAQFYRKFESKMKPSNHTFQTESHCMEIAECEFA